MLRISPDSGHFLPTRNAPALAPEAGRHALNPNRSEHPESPKNPARPSRLAAHSDVVVCENRPRNGVIHARHVAIQAFRRRIDGTNGRRPLLRLPDGIALGIVATQAFRLVISSGPLGVSVRVMASHAAHPPFAFGTTTTAENVRGLKPDRVRSLRRIRARRFVTHRAKRDHRRRGRQPRPRDRQFRKVHLDRPQMITPWSMTAFATNPPVRPLGSRIWLRRRPEVGRVAFQAAQARTRGNRPPKIALLIRRSPRVLDRPIPNRVRGIPRGPQLANLPLPITRQERLPLVVRPDRKLHHRRQFAFSHARHHLHAIARLLKTMAHSRVRSIGDLLLRPRNRRQLRRLLDRPRVPASLLFPVLLRMTFRAHRSPHKGRGFPPQRVALRKLARQLQRSLGFLGLPLLKPALILLGLLVTTFGPGCFQSDNNADFMRNAPPAPAPDHPELSYADRKAQTRRVSSLEKKAEARREALDAKNKAKAEAKK